VTDKKKQVAAAVFDKKRWVVEIDRQKKMKQPFEVFDKEKRRVVVFDNGKKKHW
jgi:hypothetical protein